MRGPNSSPSHDIEDNPKIRSNEEEGENILLVEDGRE
jgi:hypothetical protein